MGCFPTKTPKPKPSPQNISTQDPHRSSIQVNSQIVLQKVGLNLDNSMIIDTFEYLSKNEALSTLKEEYSHCIWKKIPYPYVKIQQLYGICKWTSSDSLTLSGPSLICSTETKNQFIVGGEFEKGKIISNKKYLKIFSTGAYYIGQIDKQLTPDGEGQLHINKNGEYYKGSFWKGVPHGKGQKISPNRSFKGEFKKGEIRIGKQITPKGEYEGQFQNNLKHGKGILRMNSGLLFEGQFQNGKKTGSGVIKDAKGQVISSGEWKNDKKLQ